MSALSYVGKAPANPTDVVNGAAANTILNSGPVTAGAVTSMVAGLISGSTPQNTPNTAVYATKAYVDTVTSAYAAPTAISSAAASLVPNSAVGRIYQSGGVNTPITGSSYGVASLDATGRVPSSQIPVGGAGYLLGGYGPTATAFPSVGASPAKIADWGLTGGAPYQFRPEVYMIVMTTGLFGHPVIEVFITNSTTAPANYASAGTLIALGEGRNLYNDLSPVNVIPVPDSTNQQPASLLPVGYNIWVSAWLRDANGQANGVTLSAGNIVSARLDLIRGAL